jgi:hypothetical protein
MKNYERLSFENFWPLVSSRSFLGPADLIRFSDLIGFHVYADLRLNLDVAAAEDTRQAMKCVNLLEDYTTVSDRCAGLVGARILEVQGERIHFALPSPDPLNQLGNLLKFCAALTRTVYEELKPAAGDDWRGFSMAADHGPAVLIPSSFGGGSLVSLGNAANQPAKKLSRGVGSGHLALPNQIGKALPGGKSSGEWVEIDVNHPIAATQSMFDNQLTEGMRQAARSVLEQGAQRVGRNFARAMSDGISFASTPLKTQGMCLRADLDGFTKAVEDAFKNQKVGELVKQFTELMQYPVEFARKIGKPLIELPWAGDCCTILVQPQQWESVEEMRATLPVEAGRCWQGIAYENGGPSRWSPSLGAAKWALGLACGDREEGGNGNAIIAEFSAAGRSFRVIVGWCGRKAKDAQETSGIKGDDVAVPVVDYQNLEEVLKPLFELAGSNYRYSTYLKLKNAGKSVAKPLSTAFTKHVPGISIALPAPKPFWP